MAEPDIPELRKSPEDLRKEGATKLKLAQTIGHEPSRDFVIDSAKTTLGLAEIKDTSELSRELISKQASEFRETHPEVKKRVEEMLNSKPKIADISSDATEREISFACAGELDTQYMFISLSDTREILYYDNGIYIPAEAFIEKQTALALDSEKITSHVINEIKGHICRWNFTDRVKLNANPDLICLKNGVYDLSKSEFLKHSPDYLFTQQIPVYYDTNAKCGAISKFLCEILNPNDVILVLEIFGYCLYKKYCIHKAFMFLGEGSNGKSVLINLLKAFLGSENCASVALQDLDVNRFALASLYGKLANLFADLPPYALRSTSRFKLLTGEDLIGADKKFKEPFTYTNHAKLIFSANKLPETYDDTDAFFRRWIIINCPNKFEGSKADKQLLQKLTTPTELSGLLNLALKALSELLLRGDFSNTIGTQQMREKYVRLSDAVGAYVLDSLEVSPEGFIPKKKLYSEFCEYCRDKNLPVVAEITFHRKLPQHIKVEDYRPQKSERSWRGIKFVETKEENQQTITS
jgi:putative DNA primase/helicase